MKHTPYSLAAMKVRVEDRILLLRLRFLVEQHGQWIAPRAKRIDREVEAARARFVARWGTEPKPSR